jgi:hypothetical protein
VPFYMLPVSDVRPGDTVELAADNAPAGKPNAIRVPVSYVRTVGAEVWIYSAKFTYPGGQYMPLYFDSGVSVAVERDDDATESA